MATIQKCENCGDEITEKPVRRGTHVYCSEACAFEAARSIDCSGRNDISQVTHTAEEIRQPDKVMGGPGEVAAILQVALAAELSAVEVYGQHIRAIQEADIVSGLKGIQAVEKGHAKDLTERIKTLGGAPEEPGRASTVEGRGAGAQSAAGTVGQMLQLDLSEEEKAIQLYRSGIAGILNDAETVGMLKRHLEDETAHAQWLRGKLVAAGAR
jgi:bacterioferritin (cytochrome b1)